MSDKLEKKPSKWDLAQAKFQQDLERFNSIKEKIISVVEDSVEVVHCAVKNEKYKGKSVSRTQLFAASPIVSKFAPQMDLAQSQDITLNISIPRPKKETEPLKIIDVNSNEN